MGIAGPLVGPGCAGDDLDEASTGAPDHEPPVERAPEVAVVDRDAIAALREEIARPLEQVREAALQGAATAPHAGRFSAAAHAERTMRVPRYGAAALALARDDAYSRLVSGGALQHALGDIPASKFAVDALAGTALTSGALADTIAVSAGRVVDAFAAKPVLDGAAWADRIVEAGAVGRAFDPAVLMPAVSAAITGVDSVVTGWSDQAAQNIVSQGPLVSRDWSGLADGLGSATLPHLDILTGSRIADVVGRWDFGKIDFGGLDLGRGVLDGLVAGDWAGQIAAQNPSWSFVQSMEPVLASASMAGVGSLVADVDRMVASMGSWADPAAMSAVLDDFLRSVPDVDLDQDWATAATPHAPPESAAEPAAGMDSAQSTLLRRTEEILTDEALFADFARSHDLLGVPDPVADWVQRRANLSRAARRIATSRPSRVTAITVLLWVHTNVPEAYEAAKDSIEFALFLWLIAKGRGRNTP